MKYFGLKHHRVAKMDSQVLGVFQDSFTFRLRRPLMQAERADRAKDEVRFWSVWKGKRCCSIARSIRNAVPITLVVLEHVKPLETTSQTIIDRGSRGENNLGEFWFSS